MRRIFHATLTAGFLGSTVLGAAAVTATLGLGSALMLPRGAEAGPFAPVVYVNNAAVTQYELDQRIRFMQVLRAPGADRESARSDASVGASGHSTQNAFILMPYRNAAKFSLNVESAC